jgi:hypothetical protein
MAAFEFITNGTSNEVTQRGVSAEEELRKLKLELEGL